MKALYKKYSHMSRKMSRTGEWSDRLANKEFCETLDKWVLVKLGLAFWHSRYPALPMNRNYIHLAQKIKERKSTDAFIESIML